MSRVLIAIAQSTLLVFMRISIAEATPDETLALPTTAPQTSQLQTSLNPDSPAEKMAAADPPSQPKPPTSKEICDAAFKLLFTGTGVCCMSANGRAFACLPLTLENIVRMDSFCGPATAGTTMCGSGHDGVECVPEIDPGVCKAECRGGTPMPTGCNRGFDPVLLNGRCRCAKRSAAEIVKLCTILLPSELGDFGCLKDPQPTPKIESPIAPAPID